MKKNLFFIAFLFIYITSLEAAERRVVIDSVKTDSRDLLVSFRAEGILEDKIAEGLRKGRTSTLEYKIQLWGKKKSLLNRLIVEREIRIKVYYDFWEKKFVILTPEEQRLTSSIRTVRDKCTEFSSYRIVALEKLRLGMQYSVKVEVILRPMSVENYQEIKNWLSGEMKEIDMDEMADPKKQESGLKNSVLKTFMAITGFGDRVISGESKKFKMENGNILFDE